MTPGYQEDALPCPPWCTDVDHGFDAAVHIRGEVVSAVTVETVRIDRSLGARVEKFVHVYVGQYADESSDRLSAAEARRLAVALTNAAEDLETDRTALRRSAQE